ncbi:MAG: ferredoxin [Gammaproteobacteria bacterium]|nr:MAG: ferredoxin [Gammaproteobacteria bacterium]
MGTIRVTDLEGVTHTVEAEPGRSVMELIYDAGLPIKAACFGCCSCSTCHVYVDPEWLDKLPPPGPDEEDILDMTAEPRDTSRLSCQITYNDALDGLHVTLAEDTRPD